MQDARPASPPPRPRRGGVLVALLLGAALFFAGFVALGLWQLQRLAWKEALIARVERGLATAPVAPPARAEWPALARDTHEYRRLRLQGRFDHDGETLVRASTELGTGHWVLTPLRLDDGGWVLVNRGFVPPERRERATRAADEPVGAVTVEGLLRLSEPGGSLLQKNDPAAGRWYSRDVAAIAAARGLPGPVAPFFVDAWPGPSAVSPAGPWPRAGLTVLRFSNNHRVYALTWFALAAMMAAAAGALLWQERRWRRAR